MSDKTSVIWKGHIELVANEQCIIHKLEDEKMFFIEIIIYQSYLLFAECWWK